MPSGDRTGPMGSGPMTGRSAGCCAGYQVPGNRNPVSGKGFGGGLGCGRGRFGRGGGLRNMYNATGLPGWQREATGLPAQSGYAPDYGATPNNPTLTAKQELNALKSQVQFMEDGLKAAKNRVSELQKKAPKKE